MPFYKDEAGKLHFLEDAAFTHLLPSGCKGISDEEALVLQRPSVALVKLEKWEAIKAKRDAIKAGGAKVGTKWYHTDPDSRIQHLGLKDQARDLLAAGKPDSASLQKLGQDVHWKTMDGSFIRLTVKLAFDIVESVGNLDALAFAAAETHRMAMEVSPEPESYDFSGGWPEVFAPEIGT